MVIRAIDLKDQAKQVLVRMYEMKESADRDSREFTSEEQTAWDTARDDFLALGKRAKEAEFLESSPMARDEEHRVWDLRRDAVAGPPQSETESVERDARAYEQAFRDYISCDSPRMLDAQTWQSLYKRARPMQESDRERLAQILPPNMYRAAMSVGSQTGGGFWVPDEMMGPIEKAMLFYGGMRQFADVISTDTGADLPWPVYDDTANQGRRLAENTAMTQTDIAVGVRVLKAHMYTSDEVLVSLQLLQDWPSQALSIISDALGERIGRAQNAEFTNYGGPDGPQGLITATSLGVTAAATGAVTADELRNLKYAVGRAYREHPSAKFMMSDTTFRDVIGLKDGDGDYLFMPDPRTGGEPPLWGSPVVVNNDMPAMTTLLKSIVFGKGAAYKIRDVRGFTLLRLDERYAPSLQVSFLGFARADGGYINAGQNPIQHLAMA